MANVIQIVELIIIACANVLFLVALIISIIGFREWGKKRANNIII